MNNQKHADETNNEAVLTKSELSEHCVVLSNAVFALVDYFPASERRDNLIKDINKLYDMLVDKIHSQ